MNSFRENRLKIKRSLFTLLLSFIVISCGSSMVAGISGTGIVFGAITGFGSIFVNGVEYDIDMANIHINDAPATEAELKLGMVVKLTATDNGDGTGVATSVVYDEVVTGPVSTTPVSVSGDLDLLQFTILGQTVIISATSTTFDGIGFADIAINDVVEISGFTNTVNNTIFASRIEYKGQASTNTEVELHGIIESIPSSSVITINGLNIDVSQLSTEDIVDLPEGFQVGLYVEVLGETIDSTSVLAFRIEGEDDDLDEILDSSSSINLHGIVTVLNTPIDFSVNGIPVDATSISSTVTDLITQDMLVEITGTMVDGVLVAEELKLRSGQSSYKAIVIRAFDETTRTLGIGIPDVSGELTLIFDNRSQFEDEVNETNPIDISGLIVGMEIQAEAQTSEVGMVVTTLKHKNLDEYEIEGLVSNKSEVNATLTIDGFTVTMDASAVYEINDESSTRSEFFAEIIPGASFVEVTDELKDGSFDSAEIE